MTNELPEYHVGAVTRKYQMQQQRQQHAEVDWDSLDKQKFFVNGAFIFTGLTGCLFPLTVIKTRMMALDDANYRGFRGVYITGRDVVRADGYRGLYKGFGTVVGGLIPGRILYLGVLEATKKGVGSFLEAYDSNLSEPFVASTSSFVAGGCASLSGQLITVPVDVISQRQMIQKTGKALSGFDVAKSIVARDGVGGMYRGLGASIVTFVPSSAIWWSSYGAYQSILWAQWDALRGTPHPSIHAIVRPPNEILGIQVLAGILTGCTTASITTPLDVVKTRIQTHSPSGKDVTWKSTAIDVYTRDGLKGFFRGVVPRMTSTSIWGTAMVTTYEFLKRLCAIEETT